MDLEKFLSELGYLDSPHFLRRGTAEFKTAPDFGHVFRNAAKKPCHLEGVYTLRKDATSRTDPLVPVAYVCRADSDQAADEVHRLVWNQDVVPFVLVHSPSGFRLYSGFRFQPRKKEGLAQGVLRQLTAFNKLADIAESFHSDAIDNGSIWRKWGGEVTTDTRVDWKLLDNLKSLDIWLQKKGGLKRDISHALIGKYVYLHYLKKRNILSRDRLAEWKLDESAIFGQNATKAGLRAVIERLDEWLNGSVFPLNLTGRQSPSDDLIRTVAGIFHGDEIVGNDLQLHLDFAMYDFSYIPIETLSVIYEQFLHAPLEDGKKTKGEEAAAYYTPIPVVNFMLSEMDEKLPLKRGMKVLDPACGSGAFLVQSYRRLIEREFPDNKKKPTPHQLKALLEDHIFGIDSDPDACRVTELSLILTLLDYVDPPDLLPTVGDKRGSPFKLPTLSAINIRHANFFSTQIDSKTGSVPGQFDWIVGNPPWKRLNPKNLSDQDRPVWNWMSSVTRKVVQPCGKNEVAQAFAWRATEFSSENGAIALLMPAMTLFEDPSRRFRKQFFSTHRVTAIANFSNLAEVLFAGRSRVPAAAFFYEPHTEKEDDRSDEFVTVFSPMVANQETTRPDSPGERTVSWSLLVSAHELRDIPLNEILSGDGLPWKLACWGSSADKALLAKNSGRWTTLGKLESEGVLFASQGIELRRQAGASEGLDPIPEVGGKLILDVNKLARLRHIFKFPASSLSVVPVDMAFYRKRGGKSPLSVCRPPHVIVSAARTFAVFSDNFLVVPPRQIGIVSTTEDVDFLKALSLYLSSDFAFYHQFLTASQFGVKRDVGTLGALRSIPVVVSNLTRTELSQWIKLHSKLARTSPIEIRKNRKTSRTGQKELFNNEDEDGEHLLKELNALVNDALGLDERDRALIHDLVQVKLALNDGKVGERAVRLPLIGEMKKYAKRLKSDLDAFIEDTSEKRHQIGIVFDEASVSGMIQIDLLADKSAARELLVMAAGNETAKQLEKTRRRLRRQHSQWVYFDRNLRIYEGTKTFIFKPLQRFHWTESQAMFDASEIIAETLQLGDDSQ